MIQSDIDISLNILKYSPNVKELLCFFRVYWCILDGADCNRQFIQMHFKDKDPEESKFVSKNIYTGGPMIFVMDPKVNTLMLFNLSFTDL